MSRTYEGKNDRVHVTNFWDERRTSRNAGRENNSVRDELMGIRKIVYVTDRRKHNSVRDELVGIKNKIKSVRDELMGGGTIVRTWRTDGKKNDGVYVTNWWEEEQ